MKQKTKKLLQLSFSLGFLATTALVVTSCNQPKTVTPKPTNPMQPGNGSETTTPGSGETMQPGSGSGTGTTTPDNSEAKNQLESVISGEMNNLAMYDDYSMIKSTLAQAYEKAKSVSKKLDASKEELTTAKTTLETAISTAASSKDKFNKDNASLVSSFNALKEKVKNKNLVISQLADNYGYIKTYITNLYKNASDIINAGLQAQTAPRTEDIQTLNSNIDSSSADLSSKKEVLDQYSAFKPFIISKDNFKGSFAYTNDAPSTGNNIQSTVGFSSNFNNDDNSNKWRYARRTIKQASEEESKNYTDVSWIYSLTSSTMSEDQTPASYDLDFNYYSGDKAVLYFPYKAAKSDQVVTEGQDKKLSLKYKLNDSEAVDIDVSKAKVDGIEVAEIELSKLNFGKNTISFTTDSGKSTPMIGNMYISPTKENKSKVYNAIFGNSVDQENPDKITVDLAKGYGLANKQSTIFTKLHGTLDGETTAKDYYQIGFLGGRPGNTGASDATNIQYYTFYVNVPKNGEYDISGIFNSGDNRGLWFWTNNYNNDTENTKASFKNLMFGNWSENKFKKFDVTNKNEQNPTSLKLNIGLNKIIVSGLLQHNEAPNLLNVTFTYKESNQSSSVNNGE
ncbi:hypothetical protein [Mycoplasma bradburyae]|uniref:hypothetical protein n=1 Tax=Mycoplasma bradburyae TaxID=2963128 RepID=UPI00233FEA6C|nr:hypothetical protein [Mycoplasma bradburyae]MDC4183937.1 hypothetical protein [Mycoplasma bradburyae]